jgi:hypothetical protein
LAYFLHAKQNTPSYRVFLLEIRHFINHSNLNGTKNLTKLANITCVVNEKEDCLHLRIFLQKRHQYRFQKLYRKKADRTDALDLYYLRCGKCTSNAGDDATKRADEQILQLSSISKHRKFT